MCVTKWVCIKNNKRNIHIYIHTYIYKYTYTYIYIYRAVLGGVHLTCSTSSPRRGEKKKKKNT